MTATATTPTTVRPMTIAFDPADVADLRDRLARTRFAPSVPGDGWEYGTPTAYLRDMVERWRAYDVDALEARLNSVPNYLTEIDGQTIHFAHVRSDNPDATALLLAHTYPGSCSCSPSPPAPRPSSRGSGRRSTPRSSTCSGSSPSAATTR